MKKGYLVLADGQVFEGERFGAEGDALGELVFTTGMGGYLETLTDPSYYGQIVLQTFPLIGNYGLIPADFEGEPRLKGYVVRECCEEPSNFRSEGTLDSFLKEKGIPGLRGVDTRYLTRLLRSRGVMNAAICTEVPADLEKLQGFRVRDAVAAVTRRETVIFSHGEDQRQIAQKTHRVNERARGVFATAGRAFGHGIGPVDSCQRRARISVATWPQKRLRGQNNQFGR